MPFHRPIPESKARPALKEGMGNLVEAEKLMLIAFLLPSAVAVGGLGGYWLGKVFHQGWMLLAGILLGCVSGLVAVIRQAVDAEKSARKADAQLAAGIKNPERKLPDEEV